MFDQPCPRPPRRTAEAGAAERLALFIFCLAAKEPVRAMEAIAAVIANQVAETLATEHPGGPMGDSPRSRREQAFLSHLGPSDETAHPLPSATDACFAACLRIARRAMAGALRDPTEGATRFHPIGASAAWSRTWLPTAWIGSFLFYREN